MIAEYDEFLIAWILRGEPNLKRDTRQPACLNINRNSFTTGWISPNFVCVIFLWLAGFPSVLSEWLGAVMHLVVISVSP